MKRSPHHKPLRIVCLGDSVTHGARPGVKREETFCRLLGKSLNERGATCEAINAGIGGNNTGQGLARVDADVLAHAPTHVVIMFGINDSWIDEGKTESRLTVAQFNGNLSAIISKVRASGAQPVLMTANPVWSPYTAANNATLKKYVSAAREVAQAQAVPLVDVYARFAESNIEGASLDALLIDGMHPGPAGQALIAEMLVEWFVAEAE